MGRIAPFDEHDAARVIVVADDEVDGEEGSSRTHCLNDEG
jgi:hypothetical protein